MKIFVVILISVIALLLLLFALFLFLIKPNGHRAQMDKFKSVKYAHRGLHGDRRAENSLSAFRAALEHGYGIELDVRLSSDGELVVFHDDTLTRVCGIDARVDAMTAAQLQEVKLSGTEDCVPLFSDVLSLVDGRVPLLVEIKEDAGNSRVSEKTAELLSAYSGPYIVESFNPLSLAVIRERLPDAMRGLLCEEYLRNENRRSLLYFALQSMLINIKARPDFIAYNHNHAENGVLRLVRSFFGTPTLAWTVRSPLEEANAYAAGFDGVIFENYLAEYGDGADAGDEK